VAADHSQLVGCLGRSAEEEKDENHTYSTDFLSFSSSLNGTLTAFSAGSGEWNEVSVNCVNGPNEMSEQSLSEAM